MSAIKKYVFVYDSADYSQGIEMKHILIFLLFWRTSKINNVLFCSDIKYFRKFQNTLLLVHHTMTKV